MRRFGILIVFTKFSLGILGHTFIDVLLFLVIGYSTYSSVLEVVVTQWAKAKSLSGSCINAGAPLKVKSWSYSFSAIYLLVICNIAINADGTDIYSIRPLIFENIVSWLI